MTPMTTGVASALAAAFLLGLAVPALAEEEIIGSDEFRRSCTACHGVGGRGDGPAAMVFTTKIPDLTTLAARNDGQFPFRDLMRIIDGRADIAAHGNRQMPVWGDRFMAEVGGPSSAPEANEAMVRGRMLEVVNYVAAIQQPDVGGPFLEQGAPQSAQSPQQER
ncbi:c-type cytochrome [Novispirillum sp. DQ9]|uniref:c-type cytochrome n=1 Tax=Novispirillum sp. DQ9 TaxID=3398612 RepID=UPI003C7C9CCC